MPSTWVCGHDSAPAATSPDRRITATAEFNTARFATPSGWPKPRPSHRSGPGATATTVSTIWGLPDRGLTLAYDWPWCLGVDLSAQVRWRSTHTPAGREGGDRI